ncbi:hypothetical protein RJD24_17635 [Bacillaceae bacterium IKA-2]|nr:hypothetical protein RJD24_17635 [Bacillaceae bacterium IKA-2]
MSDVVETYQRPIRAGIIGGIVAGIVFGMLMQMMGMIPMVASMVGSESVIVGWIIHMIISIVFGIGFGVIVKTRGSYYKAAVIYGVVLWILGPLVIMPMMMGMGTNLPQAFTPDQLMNLMTHVFFALILAVVYKKTI